MDNLESVVSESLNNYYTVLEKTGYIKQPDVNRLLLLQFLENFLKEYSGYVTDSDYNMISRIIDCISNSTCFVPNVDKLLPSYVVYKDHMFRKSTEGILRHTQYDYERLVN